MDLTKILLVGVLVIAAIFLIATAIVYSAPYLAALIVLVLTGKFLLCRTSKTKDKPPSRDP